MSAIEASNMDEEEYHPLRHVSPDFETLAREIQNWAYCPVRVASTEKRQFREFFGAPIHVVEIAWELIKRDSLLLEGGRLKHLLWALHFMKVYPKQSPGCSTVGASTGAVDPKTHQNWVWLFIDALVGLMDVMVSNHSVGTAAEMALRQNAWGQSRRVARR
jgi:hypothetical protein